MFAIVRTGGKQYRVAAGDKIVVEKIDGDAGDTITLGDVLLAGDGGELKSTDGLTVSAEIIAQAKGEKVTVFKKKRRHNYRRKRGHRQQHTILRIVGIGDQKAAPKAKKDAADESKKASKADTPAKEKASKEAAPKAAKPKDEKSKAADKPKAKAKSEAPAKSEPTASEMTDTPKKSTASSKKASTKKPAAGK